MTIVTRLPAVVSLPAVESPEWRRIYPVPHDVRFDAGRFCPHDDYARCLAWWDLRGRGGMWLHGDNATAVTTSSRLRRLDRRLATAIGVTAAGAAAFAAGRQLGPVGDEIPTDLVWAVVVLLVLIAGALPVWAWLARRVERARYAGGEVVGTCAELGLPDDPAAAATQLRLIQGGER
jgi:hypothetical protein